MVPAGIEAMNFYGGTAYLDVMKLAKHRNLDNNRFANLLMKQKTVPLPYEDPISYAVNAAKPLVDSLPEAEKDRIEMIVTATESGIDFGKSMSTYIHHYLGLNRNCRLFEVKQACYSGTAGFQAGINFILSQVSPGAKALLITADIIRFMVVDAGVALTEDWSFAEPSSGSGSMAVLLSETPYVFQIDAGANGYYGYEVCDTCRPNPDSEAGDADLSLLSYLDCCEQSFQEYQKRVTGADYRTTFQYLTFHTPFGGMIKGAHRNLMRKIYKAKPDVIESDFQQRVLPGLTYCQRVGNVMGGTVFLSLLSTIDNGKYDTPKRIGCFSYGSGCCSEFFSGIATPEGHERQKQLNVEKHLNNRYELTMSDYDSLIINNATVRFGTRNIKSDYNIIPAVIDHHKGNKRLVLKEIKEFHREYEWIS